MSSLGGQRIGIGRRTTVLDDDGQPVRDEFQQAITRDVVVWVDGCLLETTLVGESGLYELQAVGDRGLISTASSTISNCYMPVSNGAVPARDEDGRPAPLPVDEFTSRCWLQFGGGRYELRGDAQIEYDDQGREDHVTCLCDRTRG